jgi:hypothetical protein
VANATISGSTVTITPSGAGACVLTVADSSGLTTNDRDHRQRGAAPSSPSRRTRSRFASPSAPAQTATISGGTPPYAATGCASIAGASISARRLTVTPQAVGSCTLTIADSRVAYANAVGHGQRPGHRGRGRQRDVPSKHRRGKAGIKPRRS